MEEGKSLGSSHFAVQTTGSGTNKPVSVSVDVYHLQITTKHCLPFTHALRQLASSVAQKALIMPKHEKIVSPQLYGDTFDHVDEIDKFLQSYNLKFTHTLQEKSE